MTSSVQNLQGNIAKLEDISVSVEGVKNSLNAQLAQDQEAFVTAITVRFQQIMAASEARQNAIISELRAEIVELKKDVLPIRVDLEMRLEAVEKARIDHLEGRRRILLQEIPYEARFPNSYSKIIKMVEGMDLNQIEKVIAIFGEMSGSREVRQMLIDINNRRIPSGYEDMYRDCCQIS